MLDKMVGQMLKDFEANGRLPETISQLISLRASLIQEEADETLDALWELDRGIKLQPSQIHAYRSDVLKELCDLVYVCVGTAVSLNMDFDTAFRLVHENNMKKLNNKVVRKDGKILKPNNHPKVNLGDCV